MPDEYVKNCPDCGEPIETMEVDYNSGNIKLNCGDLLPTAEYSIHQEYEPEGRLHGQWVIRHG